MRIIFIRESTINIVDVQLPHANMVLDPRYMGLCRITFHKFSVSVNGRILTITRIDEDAGWEEEFYLRAYMPMEKIPDFTSTIYTYWGLRHEEAPEDTTEVIFHPSVNIIQQYAFNSCGSLVRITIPDTVTEIEVYAFYGCDSLSCIRLSRNLEVIGEYAFQDCESLQAVFLPPTVTYIGDQAFNGCASLRFLFAPEAIEHIGDRVIYQCGRLLTAVDDEDDIVPINNDEVNQWLMHRHANFLFHQACSSISITPQVK